MKNTMISSASIILTDDCNLNCPYCFYTTCGSRKNNYMSNDMSEKIIDFLIEGTHDNDYKYIDITFFGGEPTLNIPVMRHMFEYALMETNKKGIELKCSLITNCTIFTDEYEEFLKYCFNNSKWFNVQLSIDGIPTVLDVNRRSRNDISVADLIEKTAIKYVNFFNDNHIQQEGRLVAHGVLTKYSLPYLKESYDYIRDVIGIDSFWVMPCHEEDWTNEDVIELYNQYKMIGDRIILDCIKNHTSKYYNDFISFRCRHHSSRSDRPCSAGMRYCSITPDGSIYPCHRFYSVDDNRKLGHIDIGLEEGVYTEFKNLTLRNLNGLNNCYKCNNSNCRICVACNLEQNGDMSIGFPKYCKMAITEDNFRQNLRKILETYGLVKPLVDNSRYIRDKEFNEYNEKIYGILDIMEKNIASNRSMITQLIELNKDMLSIVENVNR